MVKVPPNDSAVWCVDVMFSSGGCACAHRPRSTLRVRVCMCACAYVQVHFFQSVTGIRFGGEAGQHQYWSMSTFGRKICLLESKGEVQLLVGINLTRKM